MLYNFIQKRAQAAEGVNLDYLRNSAIGAGVGGLLGAGSAFIGKDDKQRKKNALVRGLIGAALGGGAGAGYTAYSNYENPEALARLSDDVTRAARNRIGTYTVGGGVGALAGKEIGGRAANKIVAKRIMDRANLMGNMNKGQKLLVAKNTPGAHAKAVKRLDKHLLKDPVRGYRRTVAAGKTGGGLLGMGVGLLGAKAVDKLFFEDAYNRALAAYEARSR